MSLDLIKEKGIPLEKQKFDWHDIVRVPTSKLEWSRRGNRKKKNRKV